MKWEKWRKQKCISSYIDRNKCIERRVDNSCREKCKIDHPTSIDSVYNKEEQKCVCVVPYIMIDEDCKSQCKSFFKSITILLLPVFAATEDFW